MSKEEKGPYAIYTRAKTKSGWKRVKDTKFDTHDSATKYGDKYHTDRYGAKMYKVDKHPDALKEEAPTNSMGASSSTPGTGAIDTYDPLLKMKQKQKDTAKMLYRKFLQRWST